MGATKYIIPTGTGSTAGLMAIYNILNSKGLASDLYLGNNNYSDISFKTPLLSDGQALNITNTGQVAIQTVSGSAYTNLKTIRIARNGDFATQRYLYVDDDNKWIVIINIGNVGTRFLMYLGVTSDNKKIIFTNSDYYLSGSNSSGHSLGMYFADNIDSGAHLITSDIRTLKIKGNFAERDFNIINTSGELIIDSQSNKVTVKGVKNLCVTGQIGFTELTNCDYYRTYCLVDSDSVDQTLHTPIKIDYDNIVQP